MNERDKQLIRQREEYEEMFFSNITDAMIKSDELDKLIADRLKHIEFKPSDNYFDSKKKYINDYKEDFDYSKEYENLKDLGEPFEYPYEYEDYFIDDYFEEVLDEHDDLKYWIDDYIDNQKQFIESIVFNVIQEEQYFENNDELKIDFEIEDSYPKNDYCYDNPYADVDFLNIDDEFPKMEESICSDDEIDSFHDVDELRNEKLIKNRQKIEKLLKNHITKDDTLDKIIKEKI